MAVVHAGHYAPLPQSALVYATYIGSELIEDDIYRGFRESLRMSSITSEYLRIIEHRRSNEQELARLRDLRRNWNSYDAEPPNTTAFDRAKDVLRKIEVQRLDITKIVPSAEGGIGICFAGGDRYAHIEASNEGELTLVMFSGNYPAQVSEIKDEAQLVEALSLIRQYINP